MMIRGSLRSLKQILGMSGFVTLVCLTGLAQQPRNKTNAPARPAASDFKISEKTTQGGGQTFQSTTYIKGARQRNEMATGYGPSMVTVTQCDLKRTIQINDSARKYMINPMGGASSDGAAQSSTPGAPGAVTAGGVVTYITNTTDTGERKEMFGLTARHLKSSFTIEPSPDACLKDKMRIERDGWYVDLQYGLDCGVQGPPQMGRPGQAGGCRDQVRVRNTGNAKLGYPLVETTTIYGANGAQMMSSTKEVIELSRQPLEMALFELPAGYAEAHDYQEMYAPAADTTGMAGIPQSQSGQNNPSMGRAGGMKAPAAIRVGVVSINNKTDKTVSTESLRQGLIAEINSSGVEAIPLNALSATAAEAEAKAKGCAFILYTDVTALKTASAGKKLGGMFGRAAGVSTGSMGKSDSRVDFKLFPTGSTSPTLASSATGKEEGDEVSLAAALNQEADAVSAAVRKH
ncbi:MAG: hypothetical protein ABI596_15490 [Pyrinomonadaceae bacterium]